jgi:integrase
MRMDIDRLGVALAFLRSLGLTPAEVRGLADLLERGLPSLREALRQLVAAGHQPAAQAYPQGRRRVLDGDPELCGDREPGDGLTAYGDLPYTDLTLPRVRKDVALLHRLVGEREVAEARRRGRPCDADAARLHGHGAAEQYVRAARAMDRALVTGGLRGSPQLSDLSDPDRPGPSREQALEDAELREYLQTVLWFSDDPVLDALLWIVARVAALRLDELIGLSDTGCKPVRPSVTIAGKGSTAREAPVHSPVLELAEQLSAARPGRGLNRLFRTRRGRSVAVGRFEDWSTWLHRECSWAAGHEIRLHTLRHTTAQAVEAYGGAHSDGAALYLGHKLETSLGTIATYLGLTEAKRWTLRRRLTINTFGPLEDWPRLPENDVLAEVLPEAVQSG